MRKILFISIIIIAVLLLSACAGKNSTVQAPDDHSEEKSLEDQPKAKPKQRRNQKSLRDQSLWKFDAISFFSRSPIFGGLLGIALGGTILATVIAFISSNPNKWRWLFFLAMFSIWITLSSEATNIYRDAWPKELTHARIDQALGREGLSPGDITPWTSAAIDPAITAMSVFLAALSGLASLWIAILPIVWTLEALISQRFACGSAGMCLGLALNRVLLPLVLNAVVNGVANHKAEVLPVPLVGETLAAAQNTIGQLNGRFLLAWLLWPTVVFFATMSVSTSGSALLGPGLARAANQTFSLSPMRAKDREMRWLRQDKRERELGENALGRATDTVKAQRSQRKEQRAEKARQEALDEKARQEALDEKARQEAIKEEAKKRRIEKRQGKSGARAEKRGARAKKRGARAKKRGMPVPQEKPSFHSRRPSHSIRKRAQAPHHARTSPSPSSPSPSSPSPPSSSPPARSRQDPQAIEDKASIDETLADFEKED